MAKKVVKPVDTATTFKPDVAVLTALLAKALAVAGVDARGFRSTVLAKGLDVTTIAMVEEAAEGLHAKFEGMIREASAAHPGATAVGMKFDEVGRLQVVMEPDPPAGECFGQDDCTGCADAVQGEPV
jgi:hypothetical protein